MGITQEVKPKNSIQGDSVSQAKPTKIVELAQYTLSSETRLGNLLKTCRSHVNAGKLPKGILSYFERAFKATKDNEYFYNYQEIENIREKGDLKAAIAFDVRLKKELKSIGISESSPTKLRNNVVQWIVGREFEDKALFHVSIFRTIERQGGLKENKLTIDQKIDLMQQAVSEIEQIGLKGSHQRKSLTSSMHKLLGSQGVGFKNLPDSLLEQAIDKNVARLHNEREYISSVQDFFKKLKAIR